MSSFHTLVYCENILQIKRLRCGRIRQTPTYHLIQTKIPQPHITNPSRGESSPYRWIPLTKCRWCEKNCHLTTSSLNNFIVKTFTNEPYKVWRNIANSNTSLDSNVCNVNSLKCIPMLIKHRKHSKTIIRRRSCQHHHIWGTNECPLQFM